MQLDLDLGLSTIYPQTLQQWCTGDENRSKLADGLSNPHVGFIHSMVSLWYWVKWKCKRRKYRQRCWEFEGECPLAPGKVKRQLGEGGDIRLRARNS